MGITVFKDMIKDKEKCAHCGLCDEDDSNLEEVINQCPVGAITEE